MLKFAAAALAAISLSVTAAVAAPDAKTGEVCVQGIGKAVCCKTFKPNHDAYVSCCEAGNRGFFTKTGCPSCPMQKQLLSASTATVSCAAGEHAKDHAAHANHSHGDKGAAACASCVGHEKAHAAKAGGCASCAAHGGHAKGDGSHAATGCSHCASHAGCDPAAREMGNRGFFKSSVAACGTAAAAACCAAKK